MPDINILIDATDNASGKLKTVSGAVKDLSNQGTGSTKSKLGSLATAVGTGLKVGASAGVLALGALGGAVAVTGTNFDNMKQQAQIAFTTMLGDGDKAKDFLDNLQQFAAETPFEFPDLLQASQRLLAMGFSAEEIMPTLTSVGDAVAGLGGGSAEVDRVTTALGQMNAKGKASAEEMMQLTEAGIPAWQFLADAIGTDTAGAMEQVSKGAISADVAIGAVLAGMEGKFGGLMEKQSATFGGLLSTLKDTFSQVSGTVMGPLFEVMTNGLKGIVEWTSKPEFIQGVKDFATWIGEVLTKGGQWWSETMPKIQSAVKSLMNFITNELPNWRTRWDDWALAAWEWITKNVIPAVVTKLGELATAMYKWIADNAPTWATKLGEFATKAWDWLTKTVIPAASVKLGEWATALWGWIAANAPTWSAKLGEFAVRAWDWLKNDVIPKVTERLGEWGSALYKWVIDNAPTWATKFGAWATAAWQWIVDATPTAITKLGEWAAKVWQWVVDNAPTLLTKMVDWSKNLWQWIVEGAKKLPATLNDWWTDLSTWFNENLPKFVTKMGEWAKSAWQWVVDSSKLIGAKLAEWYGVVRQWLDENLPKLKTQMEGWTAALVQWVKDATPKTTAELGNWWLAVSGWFAQKLPDFEVSLVKWTTGLVTWIGNAIAGAINGISSFVSSLVGWMIDPGADKGLGGIKGGLAKWTQAFIDWFTGPEGLITRLVPEWGKLGTAVGTALGNINQAIIDFKATIVASFVALGAAAVQGFIDGLGSLVGAAQAKVTELGNLAAQALGLSLESDSPSKRFHRYGAWAGQGFVNGIESKLMDARAIAGKMGDVAAAAAAQAAQVMTNYVSSQGVMPTGNVAQDKMALAAANYQSITGQTIAQRDAAYASYNQQLQNASKTTNFTVNVTSTGDAVRDIRNQVELYALTFGAT